MENLNRSHKRNKRRYDRNMIDKLFKTGDKVHEDNGNKLNWVPINFGAYNWTQDNRT